MSTVAVDNLQPAAGGTSFGIGGVAKAWASWTHTTTSALLDSLNVTSLVDNGTGNTTINITNAFTGADWGVVGASYNGAGGGHFLGADTATAQAASIIRWQSMSHAGSNGDSPKSYMAGHGDLA